MEANLSVSVCHQQSSEKTQNEGYTFSSLTHSSLSASWHKGQILLLHVISLTEV